MSAATAVIAAQAAQRKKIIRYLVSKDAITAERGVSLEPALIRKMVDFGLLVEPEPRGA